MTTISGFCSLLASAEIGVANAANTKMAKIANFGQRRTKKILRKLLARERSREWLAIPGVTRSTQCGDDSWQAPERNFVNHDSATHRLARERKTIIPARTPVKRFSRRYGFLALLGYRVKGIRDRRCACVVVGLGQPVTESDQFGLPCESFVTWLPISPLA